MDIFGSMFSRRLKKDPADDSGEEKEKADKKERPLPGDASMRFDINIEEGEAVLDKTDNDDDDVDLSVDEDLEEEDLDEVIGDSDDEREKRWRPPTIKNARPPHPLTVTHVKQTLDLQRLQDIASAANAENQHSEEWLQTHSIAYLKLSLNDLVDKGKIGRLHPDQQTGKVTQHIQFDAYDVNEFEYKLNVAIELYTKRIKWLLQGSKRIFGHLMGKRVAICVDTSDANMGFGRQTAFQESLLHLIDEQLTSKTGIYLVSFGTEMAPLWPVVRDVNYHLMEEAKIWASQLRSTGGTNLLKAMKHVMKLPDVDTVVLVLGSVPDQPSELLCDYIYQMGVGKGVTLHTVAYDCSNNQTNVTLKKLADSSGGRYHCYTASCEEQIYTGTDISLLLMEIREAQDVINKIKEMRQGMMGNAIISIMNEITTEVSKLPQSRFLPRPPGHDLPLRVDVPNFHPRTSQEWLHQHGLKAKKLDLYQVLAPNAYSYREEFVPVIKKAVQSQVHEKAMVQFPWKDGSLKNLHVDMTALFEYQKQLSDAVMLYEKRVDWLASGSRRIFGTVTEKNVVVLIDTSVSNINYLVHIQHSMRLLMEEQIANKDYFNIIAFGSQARQFMPTMVRPTPEHLQKAWKWILELQCGGSRNFLNAYRMAVENDEEIKHHIFVQGAYLFTSGVPDQMSEVVASYIEEASTGRGVRLHSILFNVDDYDANGAIPGRYANITRTAECLRNMAHITGGRFHWFRETGNQHELFGNAGIIENDDIQYVNSEIDKALNFSRKCAMLVESVKKKYRNRFLHHPEMRAIESRSSQRHLNCIPAPEVPPQFSALPPPGAQGAVQPRYANYGSSSRQVEEGTDRSPHRAISWRPSSASSTGSSQDSKTAHKPLSLRQRPSSARDPMQRSRNIRRTANQVSTQHFFLDKKHSTGSVINKFTGPKPVRKQVPHLIIPEQEDSITSKEWLRVYSLSKLKLDLNRMVSGPDCKHEEKNVKILHKNITAKVYPDVFPTVNVKGTMKYMQLLPHELNDYELQLEKTLRRYLKRLQWLLSGSRRVFGTMVHKKVSILIDTSGSMEPRMEELKKELASLVWDQLHKQSIEFNFIRFSGNCTVWRDAIQSPTESNCHDAIRWVSQLMASGNTCTLEALQLAFRDPDIDAIYLLTDGKPDTSTSLVLREVSKRNEKRNISVNTISFNCTDSTANNFLRLLATETGGRYHRIHDDFDAQLFVHKLLSEGFKDCEYPHLPTFEGDDLRKLGAEISQARKFLQQARVYKALYQAKATPSVERPSSAKGAAPFVVGKPRPAPPTKS
ncbi:von Willebrand factor A domain-containing protein 3A isoform X2 [Aplysia californica]|uniref:von Willebrand factor A domain-containing protein 3A isoform X2 n=1 Tax=Aplysia californica TaxID=6500 RepID=A0ABM1VV16_APLCA|nr:von Willebrand factor A domain-containing protein 3A isoform X2 [Aplysia californica]